jgi:hypothetical protein
LNDTIKNEKNLASVDINELEAIIKNAKNLSAPGVSGISYELFKIMDKKNFGKWVEFYNQCFKEYKIVEEWCSAVTIAVPKKGGGFRPITLLETPRKIFEQLIYNRLISQVKIHEKQYGFMRDRNTLLQIINLEAAIKSMKCKQMSICFLDIKKAYDTVDRTILFEKIKSNNGSAIDRGLIRIIELLFNYNSIKFIGDGESSNEIWLEKGLVQGSKISPILYNIFIDDIAKNVQSITSTVNTAVFLYADDIAKISKTKKGMNRAIREAFKHSKRNKYQLNVNKCAIMSKDKMKIKIKKELIKNVKRFEHLRMEFNIYGIDMKAQIEKNIKKTRRKWYKAENAGLMKISNTSITARLMFLKGILLPTLEYGMEFSILKKAHADKVQKNVNYYMRRILGVTRSSNVNLMCMILKIEPRIYHLERNIKRLAERIYTEKSYTFKELENQNNLTIIKHSKIMKLIKEIRVKEIHTKKENIRQLFEPLERPKTIISDIEQCMDKTWVIKYLVDDWYNILDNKYFRIILEGIDKKELIQALGKKNLSVIRKLKLLLINKIA